MHHNPQSFVAKLKREIRIEDEAFFLKSWFNRPLLTGAVYPSGKKLAARMAAAVDLSLAGPVIEIGPGTGPVTEALIAHGVAEERLVLVEFNPEFCALLRKRFPKARVVEGDAYNLSLTLAKEGLEKAAAIVSGLPLLTKPENKRLHLLHDAFTLLQDHAPFVQFTYGAPSPMPLKRGRNFTAKASSRIWMNVPPARVWVYRQNEAHDVAQSMHKAV